MQQAAWLYRVLAILYTFTFVAAKQGRVDTKCALSNQLLVPDARPIIFECDVNNPLACNLKLLEICNFRNGTYRCECPPNHSRLPDGRCMVVNECFEPALNDCSDDATCTDTLESYMCACKPDFVDLSPDPINKPGRICKKLIDECANPSKYGVNCDPNASCKDTPESYTCVCKSGYFDVSERFSLHSGRKCEKEYDPCLPGQNDCSENATCTSNKGVYTCQCKSGFSDVSPNRLYPGRDCRMTENDAGTGWHSCTGGQKGKKCRPGETCPDEESNEPDGGFVCHCPTGWSRSSDGTRCIVLDKCEKNDCDTNANCVSRPDGFDCECRAGYVDTSPDPQKRGRNCVLPENRCNSRDKNKCSPFATCYPELHGYRCQCEPGYLDVSNAYGRPPGRDCIHEKEECSDRRLNSCDENADCVKKPGGYACLCQPGFNDVSSQANLPPGRVCTLVTNCPSQPTDLIFLVDGSGSIGSTVFRNDVLRFVGDFSTLFQIDPDQTRVGLIQFSDLIRKEFDLNQFQSQQSLQTAIRNVQYLMGLTDTGAAIDYMMRKGFNEKHGARTPNQRVARVCIVITDGRSQKPDDLVKAARRARDSGLKLFTVGVTDAVDESQLIEIAGNKSSVFIVGAFKDLNTRLRARIQKELCPPGPPGPNECPSCDPSRNYICDTTQNKCICPPGFCEDPIHKICGAQRCNPDLDFTCPYPMVCKQTPYGNHRCACPSDYSCDLIDGSCTAINKTCPSGEKWNPSTAKCEGCYPPCDAKKNQVCMTSPKNELICGCKDRYTLDPVTQVCTINECATGLHNCSQFANCTNTLQAFFCVCWEGYVDKSPPGFPGVVCEKVEDKCQTNKHNCSADADCIADSSGGFTCRCKAGFVDLYPPIPGQQCQKRVNECADSKLNNCSKNAECFDLDVGYRCVCKSGYQDIKPLEDPGRFCFKDPCQDLTKNDCWLKRCRLVDIQTGQYTCEPCPNGYTDADPSRPGRNCQTKVLPCNDPSKNDCDFSAYCTGVAGKPDDFACKCRDGYIDTSPDPINRPGRKCEIIINPCYDASKSDCDINAACTDLKNNKYNCTCKEGFKDRSPDPSKPGRVCKKMLDECLTPQLNNCSANALCRNLEDGYTCECKEGYADKSVDKNLQGRVCDAIIHPCSDPKLNECDRHAKCIAVDADYTCECQVPYRDSGNTSKKGLLCIYDGCSVKAINTCGANADCINGDGYIICRCKDGYFDAEPYRPGTNCVKEEKCGDKMCDRNLGVFCDKSVNKCVCKEGMAQADETSKCIEVIPISLYLWVLRRNHNIYSYVPQHSDLNNPSTKEIVDMFTTGVSKTYNAGPLSNSFVNSRVDLIQNPADRNPTWDRGLWIEFTGNFQKSNAPDDFAAWRTLVDTIKAKYNFSVGGTELYINEYQVPFACHKNTCSKYANCTELTPTTYTCICFQGYEDANPENPGRNCVLKTTTIPVTTKPLCGSQICKPFVGETCVNNKCVCQDGKARRDPNEPCTSYDHVVYIPIIVTSNGSQTVEYHPNFNNEDTDEFRNLVPIYVYNIDRSLRPTPVYPQVISTVVKNVDKPDAFFPDYEKGILINTSFAVKPGTDDKQLCEDLKKSIRNNNNRVGNCQLYVDPDFDFCNPNVRPTRCGNKICKPGQFCVRGKCTDCPVGQWMVDKKCVDVVAYEIPLWIIRRYTSTILFNSSYSDRQSPVYNETVDWLSVGIPSAYAKTSMGIKVVAIEVDQLTQPPNGQKGLIAETVVYCAKNGAPNVTDAFNTLIRSIVDNFNYSVGGTPLYINEHIAPCIINTRVPCQKCPEGTADEYPMIPGTKCATDPCAKSTCDPTTSRCVVLPGGKYKCECKERYVDNATKLEEEGRMCVLNFCLDFPQCPYLNGTCYNLPDQADCRCNASFTDLRTLQPNSIRRRFCHQDAICLRDIDVDYCCLGVHSCHPTARCVGLPTGGYQCRCRTDNNVVADNVPCAAVIPPAKPQYEEDFCPYCSFNGKCVYSDRGTDPTCQCATWYTGSTCGTDIRIILAIIFAILFLLLTLCCLLYFCSKCRCWRKRAYGAMTAASSADGMSAAGIVTGKESDLYHDFSIPRARLKDEGALVAASGAGADAAAARRLGGYLEGAGGEDYYGAASEAETASEASWNEEFERRVITDYKRSQTTKTTAAGDATAQFRVFPPIAAAGAGAAAASTSAARGEGEGAYSKIGSRTVASSSKYETVEDDAISEGGTSIATDTSEETNAYDKRTLVKRTHQFEPRAGRPNETFKTEVSTVTKGKETKYV